MATTFEQAVAAKTTLRARLGRPPWLRGVGVGFDPAGIFVKVNVSEITPEVAGQIPDQVDGVRVQLDAVGDILAQADQPVLSPLPGHRK